MYQQPQPTLGLQHMAQSRWQHGKCSSYAARPARLRAHCKTRSAKSSSSSCSGASTQQPQEHAVLLAYNALQNQSLFAAQCFVETVLDAYTSGANVDTLQTSLQLMNIQQGGSLLQPQDENILLSWIILVMLAARDVGVPVAPPEQDTATNESSPANMSLQQSPQEEPAASSGPVEGSSAGAQPSSASDGISISFSREVMGLLQFVKQASKLWFDEGYNVQQLQSLQATVAADHSQGQSQFLQMMQQYTRLVIITLEVIAGCKLPTQRSLDNPTSLNAPSGYTAAWLQPLPAFSTLQQSTSGDGVSACGGGLVTAAALARDRGGLRAAAVKLMTAFVGAAIGSPFCLKVFVTAALEAYEAGVPVAALHQQLQEQEFVQSGGLVPTRAQPEVLVEVNRTLFGRWLSLVYMSAAQMNAVFPGAAEQSGWAWYGGEDEVQANAMAGFVAQALLRLQQEAATAAAEQQEQQDLDSAQLPVDPLVQRVK